MNPVFAHDFYKATHRIEYPAGTTLVYSNFTPRKSRTGFDHILFFGLQAYLTKLNKRWNEEFFGRPQQEVVQEYRELMKRSVGDIDVSHIEALHDLGYLPLEIRAAEEGTLVKCGVPAIVFWNTHPDFFWLTNFIETDLSANMWFPCTSATTAFQYLARFTEYADKTCDNRDFVKYQGHDFSYRGHTSQESAELSGAAHLTCFDGTDTIPAIKFVEEYYDGRVGCSVPATEHSVMSSGILYEESLGYSQEEAELRAIRRLITEVHPNGIVSLVCDTFDYWRVITSILPQLKDEIYGRNGKLVVRPDCYDEQTEILTDGGWKFFKDLSQSDRVAQVNDEGFRDFVLPLKIVNTQYNGPMHHFYDHHGKVDLLVTPNHRMILLQDGKERIVEAEKLKKSGHHAQKMVRSAPAKSDTNNRLSDLDRLKIAFQADGSFTSDRSKNTIRFSFSKQRKIDRLKEILDRIGLEHFVYDLKDERKEIHVKIPNHGFSKTLEWVDINNLTMEWSQDFIEECSHWDSHRRSDTRFKFDSTNKSVVDVVEYVAFAAGYGVTKSHYEDNRKEIFSDVHTLHIMKDNKVGGQSWKHDVGEYNGRVYCVTVPSGKIMVRRNRCTMVCGNSGDPVKIVVGDPSSSTTYERNGSIQCLADTFGVRVNSKGYKELDSHIGLIYGDSITLDRQYQILEGLANKGFSSNNVVLGIGSYTYQYVTRDTYGWAVKSTMAVVNGKEVPLFKDPKTDDGTKRSLRGWLKVDGKTVQDNQACHEGYRRKYLDGDIIGRAIFDTVQRKVEHELGVYLAQNNWK